MFEAKTCNYYLCKLFSLSMFILQTFLPADAWSKDVQLLLFKNFLLAKAQWMVFNFVTFLADVWSQDLQLLIFLKTFCLQMFEAKMAGGVNDPDDLVVSAFKAFDEEGKW